jgi:predicted O-linked N-acetylglucosamine transferase (SPINDLY family)
MIVMASSHLSHSYLQQEDYDRAIIFYEQAIANYPDLIANYWYLGLSLLLKGQEDEAQMVWAMALAEAEADSAQIESWQDQLLDTLNIILEICPSHPDAIDFLTAAMPLISDRIALSNLLLPKTAALIGVLPCRVSAHYAELCLQLEPDNPTILSNLADLSQQMGNYLESAAFAEQILHSSHTLVDRVAANFLIASALIKAGGHWQQASAAYQSYQNAFDQLIASTVPSAIADVLTSFTGTVGCSCYFEDNPEQNHRFRNRVNKFCQDGLREQFSNLVNSFSFHHRHPVSKIDSKIKVGYLSSCLRRHSVGWLARWLLQYHDRQKFQVFTYSLTSTGDDIQQEIAANSDTFRDLSQVRNIDAIAQQIYQDEIDILVDLDSVTSRLVCGIMALRPAPVQVTWLGSDASGIPNIDYFIADPYVLPEAAQSYYAAQIWRLPQTYIAVDGFEVGTPNLHRRDLGIPSDAVVYLSCQAAFKRHPDTVRLQMQIIKSVPNSYFLIKGDGDRDAIQNFFEQIALESDVAIDRLCFLPEVATEEIHRANLNIADIVLDTYPYNGATTTLETLWMGIPLVTKMGEQFVARNSYTMLVNLGIHEGLAYSDREYIEWGIRFGRDINLRHRISAQLRQSRHTSPLWNTAQFTQDMEAAYAKMRMKFHEHY